MLREPDGPLPRRPREPKGRPERHDQQAYPAEKARGGQIILGTRWERAIFVAGLAAVFALAIALAVWF